ncbi:MAG: stringent starvation protein B [Motiliproteus sp.]|jgi:stringent starvation protein B
MTPSRPYLIRALHEWIMDNQQTPYVVVDVAIEGVDVPQEFVSDGQIVLNISLSAVQQLSMDNDAVSFSARFGGVPTNVYVPAVAVMAIYSKETGQGMSFGREPGSPQPPEQGISEVKSSAGTSKNTSKSKRPSLKVVK